MSALPSALILPAPEECVYVRVCTRVLVCVRVFGEMAEKSVSRCLR